jgi:signal peptidase I
LRWIRIGVIVVVVIACVLFALQASLQGFDAEGVSMEPALHNGDHLIVNKLAYAQIDFGLLDWAPLIDIHGHWKTPGRGDVVVFKSPKDGKELVKRVVGMPGEWVMVSNDAVYIDGKQLDEPYAQGATRCEDSCLWKVPDGQYFMLGDNRENSLDSREGWTVPLSSIDGEKLFAY